MALLLASAAPALALEEGEEQQGSALHGGVSPEIIVTAPYARERFSLPTSASVLTGEALVREMRPTLGETLQRQPGVSTTFFGPNASRPILRGQDAERVRTLTDGIGSFDVANTSVDHAVAINPFLIDRVEVIRGPSALLYGSNAVGGVVNALDRRIPSEVPDEPVHVDMMGFYGTAARERGGAASIDLPFARTPEGGALVAHVDGSFLKTSDYRTGGFIFSPALRAAAAMIGGEVAEDARKRGRVENTDARTWNIGGGIGWVGADGLQIGLSASRLASNYGIPNALELDDDDHDDDDHDHDHDHEHEHAHGHEDIRLDMRQTRLDGRALVPIGGFFETAKLRVGWADYVHDEIDDDGDIETTFKSRSFETRFELVQAARDGWTGATGAQFIARDLQSIGEEAYIPENRSRQFALFTLQSFDLGGATGGPRIEAGLRWENSDVFNVTNGDKRIFNAVSGSLGGSLPLADGWRLSGSLTHTERAPSSEELLADGPHLATRAFEVGDINLRKEVSNGLEAVLRGRGEGWRVELSAFYTRFRNFIYLDPTGDIEDGLPEFRYRQSGARFWGAELEAAATLAQIDDVKVEVTGLIDFTRADLLGDRGPVPRIPPLRLLGGVQAGGGAFGGRLEVEHASRQSRITAFEELTRAWTMVNASINWRPLGTDNATMLILSANNIFDVEARRHSSFVAGIAPLPGRDIRLTARLSF
jgi:iron complex outermembrane receptor protein